MSQIENTCEKIERLPDAKDITHIRHYGVGGVDRFTGADLKALVTELKRLRECADDMEALQERLAEAEGVIGHYNDQKNWACGTCFEEYKHKNCEHRLHDCFDETCLHGYDKAREYQQKYGQK